MSDTLRDALESIRQYGSDTLSGRTDGPDDRAWQRAAVAEMTRRARAALAAAEQPAAPELSMSMFASRADMEAAMFDRAPPGPAQPGAAPKWPAMCEWTNCIHRVGDICCHDRQRMSATPQPDASAGAQREGCVLTPPTP